MQTKKKAYATLIVAMFALSMFFAVIRIASAVPIVSVDPTSGSVGDEITVSGTADFAKAPIEIYWDWEMIAETTADGAKAYSENITVPEAIAGIHIVAVKDTISGDISPTPADFTVIPEIELEPAERGLVGDTITVEGTGFGEETHVYLYFGSKTTAPTETIETGTGTKVEFSGTLDNRAVETGSVSIDANVTVGVVWDWITITDDWDGGLSGTATIGAEKVNATGTIIYRTGVWSLTFTHAPSADKPILADYDYYEYYITPTGLRTSDLGSFSATFKVPDVDDGPYPVTAIDQEENKATEVFAVGFYVLVDPEKGSHGTEVSVKGALSPRDEITLEIGKADYWSPLSTDPATIVSDSAGYFEGTFVVPNIPWDDYWVKATDEEEPPNEVTAAFEVAPPAEITLTPTSGLPGRDVTVEGTDFSEDAEVTLYFNTMVLDTDPATIETDAAGDFTASFEVPDVSEGSYTVKAEDEEGLSDTAKFTVTELRIVIRPRAGPYYRGSTMSFYINSTIELESIDLEISDSEGYPFQTIEWTALEGDIIETEEGFYVVPYYEQAMLIMMPLPSDAPLGKWEWEATVTDFEGEEYEYSDVFTLVELPYTEMLSKLKEVDATLTGIEDGVATIETSTGTIEGTVTALSTDVVAIKTDLGTVTGKVTTIDGSVATIKTDLGTVKADVSDIKGEFPIEVPLPDLTPMWVAAILSLIAAVAAIAAVVQISRKLA